jgi:choline-sulfatase
LTIWRKGNDTVRTEHWRNIRYADGSEELYDYRNDPNEWTNLVAQDP